METKEIIEKLNNFCESFFSKNVVEMDVSLFKEAAERLEELEEISENWCNLNDENMEILRKYREEITELKYQLSEQQPKWIMAEDSPPPSLGYYLVTALDLDSYKYYTTIAKWHGHMFTTQDDTLGQNLTVIAWLPKSANPAPLVPTFRDVFLKAFPKAPVNKNGIPTFCIGCVFPQVHNIEEMNCDWEHETCWNQPYFAEGEGEEGEADA